MLKEEYFNIDSLTINNTLYYYDNLDNRLCKKDNFRQIDTLLLTIYYNDNKDNRRGKSVYFKKDGTTIATITYFNDDEYNTLRMKNHL